ncbi:MAG TPA: GYF domain-containing protein [Polyangiaceae bacterium]|nr:GYF domain-containing protein [Polyangiaceae bacterium]
MSDHDSIPILDCHELGSNGCFSVQLSTKCGLSLGLIVPTTPTHQTSRSRHWLVPSLFIRYLCVVNPSATRPWPVSPYFPASDDVDAEEIIVDEETDEKEEKWHVQVAEGDVRVVTLEKLDDLFRFDVIDQNTFVWQPGMSNWVRLSSLLGASEPEQEDEFHVLFSPGNVRTLSLEQLDEFYRHSIIDEGTMVWRTGMREWQTLGRVAGIDEAVLSTHPAQTLAKPNTAATAYAKTAMPTVPPLSARAAQAANTTAAPAQSAPARGPQRVNTTFPSVPPPSARAAQQQRVVTTVPTVPPPSTRRAQAQRATTAAPANGPPSERTTQYVHAVPSNAPPATARVAQYANTAVANAPSSQSRSVQHVNTAIASAQQASQARNHYAHGDASAYPVSARAAEYANAFAQTSPSARAVQHARSVGSSGSQAYTRAPAAQVSPAYIPSAPPVSLAVASPYGTPAASRGGRWLLRLAIVVGGLLALIQNDVIYGAIEKTPLAAQYESAERSLFGGPVFGTTRSVDRFLATAGAQLEPVRLPIAVTQFVDGQKHGSVTKTPYDSAAAPTPSTKNDVSSPSSTGSSTTGASAKEASATNAPSANSPTKAQATKDEKPGRAATPERTKAMTRGSKPASAPPASKRAPAATGAKSGVKAGGSYYDPLNGAL